MMHVAIQCRDDRTGEKGTFAFRNGRSTVHGVRFYSLTPVFDGLVELYKYCGENKIELHPLGAPVNVVLREVASA